MLISPRPRKREFIKRLLRFKIRKRWLVIEGQSMVPSLWKGQYVLLDSDYYKNKSIRRGDIVAFRAIKIPKKLIIKRVIGLPGDSIELVDNKILINGSVVQEYEQALFNLSLNFPISLKDNEYFVLGDNPQDSLDSRKLGVIPITNIEGLIWLRLWPPKLL